MADENKLNDVFYNNRLHPAAADAAAILLKEGLTMPGLEAIMHHANPFPDKPVTQFEVPQGEINTITTVVRNQVSIIKPATLTVGKKWGFAIIEHPLITFAPNFARNYTTPGTMPTAVVPSTPQGSLFSAFAFDDDVLEIDLVGKTASGGLSADLPQVGFDKSKVPGTFNLKMIAQAVEIENTTEELYKGGSVTAARFDMTKEKVILYNSTYNESCNFFASWPYRYVDVASNPSAVSWEAKDGIYMPNTFRNEEKMSFRYNDFMTWLIGRTTPNVAQNPVAIASGSGSIDTGYSCKVAIFRGLSEQSSFLLNTIAYIETQQDSQNALFPISRPEPAVDPMFEKYLSEVSKAMPVATVFKGNALGSWFTTVCNVVSGIAKGIRGVGGIVGQVAGWVHKGAKWAGNFNEGIANTRNAASAAVAVVPRVATLRDANVTVRPGDDIYVRGTGRHLHVPTKFRKNHRIQTDHKKKGKKGKKGGGKKGPAKKAGKGPERGWMTG